MTCAISSITDSDKTVTTSVLSIEDFEKKNLTDLIKKSVLSHLIPPNAFN